jgi:hypothetical protein
MARKDYSAGGIGCLAVFFLGLVALCSGGGSDERSSRGSDYGYPPSAIIPARPAPATDTPALLPPVVTDEGSRQLHVGPRGGCYYVGDSGGKVYVDRSECARAGASAAPEPLISPERGSSTPRSVPGERQLHVGSRGGCYYIGDSGEKEYVDRSECSRTGTSVAPQPLLSTGSGASVRRSGGGRELHVGPRGGCYYINANGNKTYVDRSACH